MTDHPPELTLAFKGNAIRIAMIDGVPWFSLTDICEVMSYYGDNAAALSANLPDHVCRDCFVETEAGETVDATLISAVGVWYLSTLTNPARFQQLAAWARKEAQTLCPDPQPDDPAMFLTLLPGAQLPPRPLRYSGRLAEWENLRDATITERSGKGNPVVAAMRRQRALAQAAASPS